jgi:hypothetical protein
MQNNLSTINFENMWNHPFEEYFKLTKCGDFIYIKRLFNNGEALYFRVDVNDPGENETPISSRAYRSTRFDEIHRRTYRP